MPLGPYPDWKTCLSAQRRKGKSPESARKICGALEQRSKNASQVPNHLKPALERSQKALKFLERNNVAVVDTSLDDQDSEAPIVMSNQPEFTVSPDEESYADKITRIMDEYNVSEEKAVQVVSKLIEDEQRELERRSFEIMKTRELEKAQTEEHNAQDSSNNTSNQE